AKAMASATTERTETTKTRERESLGRARALACWRGRLAIANFSSEPNLSPPSRFKGKPVSARRRNQTRETRALPRISWRRCRIRLRATGLRTGCRTWVRLAWLANGRCPRLLRAPGSSTCLSRDRRCQNKEARNDRASRSTISRANDPADRVAAAGRIFQLAQDWGSPLRRLLATRPPARQNSEASAYSAGT